MPLEVRFFRLYWCNHAGISTLVSVQIPHLLVTIQLLIVVLNRNSAEFGVTIAAIPVVLALLAACGVALQREIKWCAHFIILVLLGCSFRRQAHDYFPRTDACCYELLLYVDRYFPSFHPYPKRRRSI
jgi:hypothetical protein